MKLWNFLRLGIACSVGLAVLIGSVFHYLGIAIITNIKPLIIYSIILCIVIWIDIIIDFRNDK